MDSPQFRFFQHIQYVVQCRYECNFTFLEIKVLSGINSTFMLLDEVNFIFFAHSNVLSLSLSLSLWASRTLIFIWASYGRTVEEANTPPHRMPASLSLSLSLSLSGPCCMGTLVNTLFSASCTMVTLTCFEENRRHVRDVREGEVIMCKGIPAGGGVKRRESC